MNAPRINEELRSAIGADGVAFAAGDLVSVPLASGGDLPAVVRSIVEAQTREGERWQCVAARSSFGTMTNLSARKLRRIAC